MSHEPLGQDIDGFPGHTSSRTQAFFRQLADSSKVVVWTTDASGFCVHINNNTCVQDDGISQLNFADWLQLVHPDDVVAVRSSLTRAHMAMEEYELEYRIVSSDGTERWMHETGVPRFGDDGAFAGYRGSIVDTTKQHDALAQLARREADYRLLAESTSDLICRCDADGTYLYISPSYTLTLGYELNEVKGKKAYEFLHPDDVEVAEAEIKRLTQPGSRSRVIEIRKRHKDTHYVWMGTKIQILLDPLTKAPVGSVSVSRDITVERQEKLERRKSEERFLRLTHLSSDWYWETDEHDVVTYLSKGAQKVSGIAPEHIIGKRRGEYGGTLNQQELNAYRQKVSSRESFKDLPFSATHPLNGASFHVSISGEPVYEGGQFKGYHGIGHDITAEKEVLEQLSRLANENKDLINHSLDIIALLDESGCFTRVNPAVTEVLGYLPEEWLGRQYTDFLHPEDLEKTRIADAALRTGKNTIQDFGTRWIRKDGSVAYLSVSARWTQDSKTMYATARDVTDRYHVQAQLQKSREEMSAMLESIGDAFFALDQDWRIIYANEKAAKFVGVERQSEMGKLLWDVAPEVKNSSFIRHYQRAMTTRAPLSFEEKWAPSNTWVEVRVYPQGDGIAVYFHDITERRLAEQAAQESSNRLRDVITMTPAGYLYADGQANIIDVNPALCTLTGYNKEQLVGAGLETIFSYCPWHGALAVQHGPSITRGMEATIQHKDGHNVPVIFSGNIKRNSDGHAESFTAFLTDITERKQVENQLEELVTHDMLTGLPNRALINRRLQAMIDTAGAGDSIAVMFIDLDRFKQVNDSMGHAPGDMLLRQVASRFLKNMRPNDIVARLGGDEFVVAAHCSEGRKSASRIAQRLLDALTSPFEIEGQEVFVGASIGISMFAGDAQTKELLFQNADIAMYRAKSGGRSNYCFFEAEMSDEAKLRMTLEHSLRRALERDEFELHYQPRVNLRTMQVVGIEALIRWNHPQLGRVPPLDFIPIAEDRGLIESIGRWVLEEACQQVQRLNQATGRQLHVSVNLSARQLRLPDLIKQVENALTIAGLPPALLELELTETALIEDLDASVKLLKQLKGLGVLLSVDDFGTGYSGLSYLKRFPVDILKLDRSFVNQQPEEVTGFEFVKAFVDMAHALKLSVTAEGIETDEILQLLIASNCDEGQGYFFAKPMEIAELKRFLSQ